MSARAAHVGARRGLTAEVGASDAESPHGREYERATGGIEDCSEDLELCMAKEWVGRLVLEGDLVPETRHDV